MLTQRKKIFWEKENKNKADVQREEIRISESSLRELEGVTLAMDFIVLPFSLLRGPAQVLFLVFMKYLWFFTKILLYFSYLWAASVSYNLRIS